VLESDELAFAGNAAHCFGELDGKIGVFEEEGFDVGVKILLELPEDLDPPLSLL
jgi:hypothetical protein